MLGLKGPIYANFLVGTFSLRSLATLLVDLAPKATHISYRLTDNSPKFLSVSITFLSM
ncbi:hypothetical protein [Sulfolobus ellipsoid virus 1]|uniref:Uncharacterized protein n=1 Tax=Sulfolobus ellipsoid virus 1 TaxID=2056194 RepID=A0A2H4RBP8_9VIRU|nr:hypothetical protein FGG62_gp22 [Sulfolobus ellipsoid virus 1]ATY46500.1 hypothetical protein [Sulfolobus ellipsoid virus 1]